jgi:HSP20 family molecular chaperone IbpA
MAHNLQYINKKHKTMLFKRINELNNSIDDHFKALEAAFEWPRPDLKESYVTQVNDDNYQIFIALPGHTKESIVASIDKGHLFINAVAKKESPLVSNQSFRYKLPKDCELSADLVDAKMENGILTVTLAKVSELKGSAEIKIK